MDEVSALLLDPALAPPAKSRRLFQELPRIGQEQQVETVFHILNLGDASIARLWVAALVGRRIPEPAAGTFFDNLPNLPQELFVPALKAIASNPDHHYREESLELLELLREPGYEGRVEALEHPNPPP